MKLKSGQILLILTSYLKEEVICSFVDGSTGTSQDFSPYTTLETTRCFLGLHSCRNSRKISRPFVRSAPYVKEKVTIVDSQLVMALTIH